MLKVAITGNIASGKSVVEKILESKGYKIYDTDKIAHEILENSSEVKQVFGTTDRKKIAEVVFSDSEKLKLLESIIHPRVKDELNKIFSNDLEVVFISVPQLFETGFDNLFDKVIYVTADRQIRLERLMKRNSLNEEEALKRINAQNEAGKVEKSDFVIVNNSDLEKLDSEVEKILSILVG
jgi:dephospho-CoA kinase